MIAFLKMCYRCSFFQYKRVSVVSRKDDSVFGVTSKRSTLDKCKQPVRIRLFVSAAHTVYDLHKAYESQKEPYGYTRVNCSAQSSESEHSLAIQDRAYRGDEDSLQLDKKLERMEHNISLLPLTNYNPSVQDLQRELGQLHQEIWNIPYGNERFAVYAEHIDASVDSSPSTTMLSKVACSFKNAIVGGSILERYGDKMYNTCYYSSSLHKKVYECGQMQGKRKIC
ncbi:nitrilase/cyanide hydratase and apolipoprotein N-acyltransferase family protein [Tanacetum coccineum]